ncbi:hypothetical protein RSAG8_13049, partial [Rhizoctonia solani AG-8 WAC10335]
MALRSACSGDSFVKITDLRFGKHSWTTWIGKNEFHPDRWDFQEVRASCEQAGKPINLVWVWSGLLTSDASNVGHQQLVHLAINVLSIVAYSTGCERVFSEMGYTQSKRRSRLSKEKTFDTAVVRMELKRNHAAAKFPDSAHSGARSWDGGIRMDDEPRAL